MDHYMDDNWKLSKDHPCSRSYSSSKSSYHSKSSNSKSFLPRSFSQKPSSSPKSSSSSSKSGLSRSSSSRKSGNFARKCSSIAKEQKAKFYIVKRCITMLVRWSKNGDS